MDTDEEYTKVFSGLQNLAKSEHRFRLFTSRTDVCKKKLVSFQQAVALSNRKVVKENFVTKFYKPGDRVFFRNYRGGKSFWEDKIITKRLGRVIYTLKGRKFECKRHLNQLRPRYIKDVMQKDREEMPMEVIYDAFEIPVSLSQPELIEVSTTLPVPKVPVP